MTHHLDHFTELDRLTETAWQKRDANPAEARSLADRARAQAEASGYDSGLGRSLTTSSFLHYRAGRFGDALQEALTALKLLETSSNPSWLPRLYNILGITHDALGNRPLALDFLFKQLELSRQLGDTLQEAVALHDLGLLADNNAKAKHYFEQALGVFRALNERWSEAIALLNLAEVAMKEKDYEQAFAFAKAVQAIGEHEGKAVEQAYTMSILAEIYASQEQFAEALQHYQKSLDSIAKSHNELSLKPTVLLGMGRCQARLGAKGETILAYFQEALQVSETMDYRTMVYVCHQALSESYKTLGEFEKALYHFEQFHTLKETIFNEESEQKTRGLEVLHQTESAKQEARAQQRKNAELGQYISELESLNQQVKELSVRDPLTGLYNRRYLFEHLARLTKQADEVSIALLDVDHFKHVNDTFSHQVGDEVLKGVATLLSTVLRTGDVAARYGGEEFVIVFPETSVEQAFLACERLRTTLQTHLWNEALPNLRVSASIGIAFGRTRDYEALLSLADKHLYTAKLQGRNRVVR
jgi:diguanylate cyclase (GGDEF)-like protein